MIAPGFPSSPSERRNKRWKRNGEWVNPVACEKQAISNPEWKQNQKKSVPLYWRCNTLYNFHLKHETCIPASFYTSTPLYSTLLWKNIKWRNGFVRPPLFDVNCRIPLPRLFQLNYLSKHLCSLSVPHIIVSNNSKLNPWNSSDNEMWKWLHNRGWCGWFYPLESSLPSYMHPVLFFRPMSV
jgi:hypothetical protein